MERYKLLADPNSVYSQMVYSIIRDGALSQKRAEEARLRIILPMLVSDAEKAELERRFLWKLDVRDYGIRSSLPSYIAALAYLMSLRNSMLSGSDGEEAVYIDGDLPSMVAKGMSYGHVCRTHATARLRANYQLESMQIGNLYTNAQVSVSMAAKTILEDLNTGVSTRVCSNAATCTRMADTVYFNHIFTPASLAQVVATARAHKASVVRGVCLFQPEMLFATEGELLAFPGKYLIDRKYDVITFVPRSDASMSFSHPYNSLMSFFRNHEYVDESGAWLVEKHLSGDGVFHYLVKHQAVEALFPEVLSANYYTEDMTKWVYLNYTSFVDEETGVISGRPQRVRVPLLKSVYEKVMPLLMSIDLKRLTFEEVFSCLRNHNNMVFASGDVVKKPERVWYDMLRKAVVPLKAMALVRREVASEELRRMLDGVRKRTGVGSASHAALLLTGLQSAVASLRDIALVNANLDDAVSLVDLHVGGIDMSVYVEEGTDYINVQHLSGDVRSDYGPVESWLPGKPSRLALLIARARAYVASVGVSVHSSDSSVVADDAEVVCGVDADQEVEGAVMALSYSEKEEGLRVDDLGPGRDVLLQKLAAQHDAKALIKPPRLVEVYEGATRVDVDVFPVNDTDPVSVAQEDYDIIFPGVSLSDEEVKPVMFAESDVDRFADFVGEINDAKRELPKSRVIRRSKLRTGGGGNLPGCQALLMGALCKRNIGVPNNRGFVPLQHVTTATIDAVVDVCYRSDWKNILNRELENGLWQLTVGDLEEYVPKVATKNIQIILNEFFTTSDENLYRWLLMMKNVVKPPVDASAAEKVQMPQTIMYSDQKSVNSKYSAMQTRFFHVVQSMLRPEVSFNSRDSPVDHEIWYNSLQGRRHTVSHVYGYEGDISCYDRSQEHVGLGFELAFYRRHGLDETTLLKWSETHGVKKATSMMYGIVIFIMMQGLSGIWKTLFRNGLICLGSVIYSFDLKRDDFVSLDVVGDDFAIEAVKPLQVAKAVEHFALTFNLTAKLYGTDVAYMCGKYWIRVNEWWYYVQDPIRRIESVSRALDVSSLTDDALYEKWVSFRSDCRHYDNMLVMHALASAVKVRMNLKFEPFGILRALAAMASDYKVFSGTFGPEEFI